MLALLGTALTKQVQYTRSRAANDELIGLGREALRAADRAGGERRADYLSLLGCALRLRVEHPGRLADLEESVAAHPESLAWAASHGPLRADLYANSTESLRLRYNTPGASAEAADPARRALDATPADDANRVRRETNLTIALGGLYKRTGAKDALDEAIARGRRALEHIPPDDPEFASFLSDAGTAL